MRWSRWIGRICRKADAALRPGAALWLVFYIVYTPVHLYSAPHSDGYDRGPFISNASGGTDSVAAGDHEEDEHHSRHAAAQHKFKVTQSTRAAAVEMLLVTAATCPGQYESRPQFQGFGFSGLSPPELNGSWQFLFRAALPARAPCFSS